MTILLTGYEPFGEHAENPSGTLATRLDGERIGSREVVGRVLPVEFARAGDELRTAIDAVDPELILATGLAAGRGSISVERVAINVDDAGSVPDNAEATPRDERIAPNGPDAYLASVAVVEGVDALLAAGIPARVSNTAGTHCCNHALYAARDHTDVPAGFVHLPATPEQAARKGREGTATSGESPPPSMAIGLQERAIRRLCERW